MKFGCLSRFEKKKRVFKWVNYCWIIVCVLCLCLKWNGDDESNGNHGTQTCGDVGDERNKWVVWMRVFLKHGGVWLLVLIRKVGHVF